MEFKVGQSIYDFEGTAYVINKVGRKWLTVQARYRREERVELETLMTEKDYRGISYQMYTNLEEINEIKRNRHMVSTIEKFFSFRSFSGFSKMSEEDLQTVYSIVNKYK